MDVTNQDVEATRALYNTIKEESEISTLYSNKPH